MLHINGLINTVDISKYISGKATCIQKSRPHRTAAPKGEASPRGAADKLLGLLDSGQHWKGRSEEALPVMQEQREAPGG